MGHKGNYRNVVPFFVSYVEKENEIKRRKEGVSLADTLLKLKSTSNEILEKYKYHTTENNRKLALGIILGTLRNAILIKSGKV